MTETNAAASLLKGSNPGYVVKRDGHKKPFDAGKIERAILKAGEATGAFSAQEAYRLAEQVMKVLRHSVSGEALEIERIQDVVEQVLISGDYFETARAYIVYREKHAKLRETGKVAVDVISSIDE